MKSFISHSAVGEVTTLVSDTFVQVFENDCCYRVFLWKQYRMLVVRGDACIFESASDA